jgi:hypothetical protein
MLETVATQTPRNSRGAGGGPSRATAATSPCREGALQLMQLNIRHDTQMTEMTEYCMAMTPE